MTTKVQYPEKHCTMLLVRDCTVAICCNNNPGSVLLSTLLFWHDYPRTGDYHDEKAHIFTMCRTQAEIQIQSCNQIDTKTIHDTAVPLLQLFGYLTVKEKMNGNLYILHMDRINAAYAVCRNTTALHNFLKSSLQLESAPIEISEDQLESTLINKRALYSQLARVLIATRVDSNCKRGRKPKSQAPSDGNSPKTESNRDSLETNTKREESNVTPTSSPPRASLSPSSSHQFIHSNQGVVTNPPASVWVPLSSNSGGDTLNLEMSPATGGGNTQPLTPDPVGEAAPTPLSDDTLNLEMTTVTGHAQPLPPRSGETAKIPIVASEHTTTQDAQQNSLDAQYHMNPSTSQDIPKNASEPPDSDALLNLERQGVASNDTVSLTAEQQLLRWITDECIPRARNPEVVTSQIAALVEGGVTSLEQLKSLRVQAQDEINADESRKDKTCYLGNMVTSLNRRQPSPGVPEVGMTEAQLSLVFDALPECIPNSALQLFPINAELFTLRLMYGEHDYYEIVRFEDAPFIYGHHQVQADCAAYGQQVAQSLEVVAV